MLSYEYKFDQQYQLKNRLFKSILFIHIYKWDIASVLFDK